MCCRSFRRTPGTRLAMFSTFNLHYTENPDGEIFQISGVNTKNLAERVANIEFFFSPLNTQIEKRKRFSSIPRLRKGIKSVGL
jgi:hypothetical protein